MDVDFVLQQIKDGNKFSFSEKSDPLIPRRLRRLPSGYNCATDIWYENFLYSIDKNRSCDKFFIFTSAEDEHDKYNWWINIDTKEICYNASSSMNNVVEKDNMTDFNFVFP
jgi:hypothetical protein